MWIDTVAEMVRQNKDVQFANLENVEEISTRKSGWGYIKIAIPNELAQRLLSKQDMNGGLLLFDKSDFSDIEAEATSKWNRRAQPENEPIVRCGECECYLSLTGKCYCGEYNTPYVNENHFCGYGRRKPERSEG